MPSNNPEYQKNYIKQHYQNNKAYPYCHITAAELFQCLITSITNGEARLRLEFIVCNHHHKPTFESRMGTL